MREQNALPADALCLSRSKAKDDVDNVGAGCAAKGENLVFCAKNTRTNFFVLVFFYRIFRRDSISSKAVGEDFIKYTRLCLDLFSRV